ncbi:MAG: hypothetical protein M1831_003394 [Alyxoria varia]|nr:MAG: hypothetical protein M1831_003394 [Alyxoria varia]
MVNMSGASANQSSVPLADYFFISGIESSKIFDSRPVSNGVAASPALDTTIEENGIAESESETLPNSPMSPDASSRKKRFSWEARKSISSFTAIESKTTSSNRSSATIRPAKEGGEQESPAGLGQDFDEALKKFAADRDSVLNEISFSAGQTSQPNKPAPRPKPKTQRIINEDSQVSRSSIGTVKRRLSTMNPLSKQSTVRRGEYDASGPISGTANKTRPASARMSKRLSGYNAVIPSPNRFQPDPNLHPLKRPYEPVLLDQYPSKDVPDESKTRSPFPDFVPMFVFPNDVNVVPSDERPRSTWHGFAMTQADGSKLYGITLIVWIPLKPDVADELERQCEEWRKKNMSDEERELANSLGERLANSRAQLSDLLAQLPQYSADTPEREAKEDELSAVEERITMMTELLRPVRHGAAAKIPGLTDSETGLWMPRAYGVLGKDVGLTSFWKEWLRAIAVPMMNGAVLRVPPSSPRVGMWQPLERYVVNLCAEALSPLNSITQVELSVRDLRMYARKEASNEIPGSRNTDLYPLFRSLDIPDIVVLLEYVLSESRIIILSSHTSMLHLVTAAIIQLMYPLKWAGIFIPVLPARLIQALEAPCPYIIGIERRYENVELPAEDIVLVDLDNGTIEATDGPLSLPRPQRRKLISILQLAAPHHYRFGVPIGPPKYAAEAYPFDTFCSENPTIFHPSASPSNLAHLAALNSTSFGTNTTSAKPPVFNAFVASRQNSSRGSDRPSTGSSANKSNSPPSPTGSPLSGVAPPGALGRHDSGHSIQSGLREKRSGLFDSARRSSSIGLDRVSTMRRPTIASTGHQAHASTTSISTLNNEWSSTSQYAPSVYAQSTLAASTVMPNVMMHPVQNTETTQWVEGHQMVWRSDIKGTCSLCDSHSEEGVYRCTGCGSLAHGRCISQICMVCPVAFHPDQIMAAFVRCFASLFYTYRKFMASTGIDKKKAGQYYKFNSEGFLRSVPHDTVEYMSMLRETQAFQEFAHERETKRPDDPSVKLFDEIILSKRNRGRQSFFSKSQINFLSDTSDHLWRSAAASSSSNRQVPQHTIGRVPAKLDPSLLKEPRMIQGVPRVSQAKPRRKQVPSMLNPGGLFRSNTESQ